MKKVFLFLFVFSIFFLMFFSVSCTRQEARGEPITIGTIFPLTGRVSFFGNESKDGVILAVEEINAGGGLLGRRIVLISEDDEGDGDKARASFNKLTTQDNVSIVIGSSTSGVTMAIAPLAQQAGVVLISPTATNVAVTRFGNYIFRACFIDPFQGLVGAEFAFVIQRSRRAAILFDMDAEYNSGLADAFRRRFTELGGHIVADETYNSGDTDFSAQVARIRAANPDIVYLPNYFNDVAMQAKELRAQGVNVALVGGDGWDGVIDIAGDEIINSFYTVGFVRETTDPKGAAFVRAFESRFNRPASQFAALGYDAMMIVADAIRDARSFESVDVRNAMATLRGSYVTGDIRFDFDRNPIKSAAILGIIEINGRLVSVYATTIYPW